MRESGYRIFVGERSIHGFEPKITRFRDHMTKHLSFFRGEIDITGRGNLIPRVRVSHDVTTLLLNDSFSKQLSRRSTKGIER